FWSISPKLPETLDALATQGQTELTLLPHFLFEGGITDAIARQVQTFSDQISVVRHQPFGHSPAFAEFLAQAYAGGPQPPTETDPDRRPELSLV
ncbi:MAG: CbiX/SirB N-terminal domain-containing protein, partial [Cyanobacteria bacterium P01_H01_bin.130]